MFIAQFFIVQGQDTTKVVKADSINYFNLSIDDLNNLESNYNVSEIEKLFNNTTDIASKSSLSIKRSPSIISVLSRTEIEKSGAREIIDLLNFIPSIQFNLDIQGSVSFSIKGMPAQDGKVLILLDGLEMNENAFGTPQFARQYPIDLIQQIEVIQGPGSSSYGGYASYSVISITTKNATEINGGQIHSSFGTISNAISQTNFSFGIGEKYKRH